MPQAKKAASKNGQPKILSLEDIQNADDLGSDTVDVPEWGGAVKVRGLGHGEVVDVFRDLDLDVDDEGNLRVPASRAGEYQVALIVRGAVEPEFDEDTLRSKAAAPVGRLADAISALSGLGSPQDIGAGERAAEKDFS